MMVKSLTPKTFYHTILFSFCVIALVTVISLLSQSNLVGLTVAEDLPKITAKGQFYFIPCPLTYKNEASTCGDAVEVQFSPIFKMSKIKPNILAGNSLSWGRLHCVYESTAGNKYRLHARTEGKCMAVDNGFLCKKL